MATDLLGACDVPCRDTLRGPRNGSGQWPRVFGRWISGGAVDPAHNPHHAPEHCSRPRDDDHLLSLHRHGAFDPATGVGSSAVAAEHVARIARIVPDVVRDGTCVSGGMALGRRTLCAG